MGLWRAKDPGQSLWISLTSGNFAFGLFGIDAGGNRYGGAGYFATDATGNISAGLADIDDNDTVQSQASLTGSVSFTPGTTTGRGTATFTIGATTLDYALYVVAPSTGKLFPSLLAVQTDPVSGGSPLTLASMAERAPTAGGGFTNLFLNATRGSNPNGNVFELDAVSTAGGTPVPDTSLGLGNFDGNGNITSYAFDENNGGTLTTQAQNNYTGTYSVDKTTGRVAVSLSGVANNPVWYLVGFNTGYVVGTDPNVTVGSFEPQTVQSPISILSLFGNFYGGTDSPVLPSVINEVEADLASPPPPPGSGNGIFDSTYDSSGTTGVLMNQTFMFGPATPPSPPGPGGFCIADGDSCPNPQQVDTATGRMLIVDNNGNPYGILYLVSGGASGATNANTKSVILSTGAQPSLSVIVH